MTFDPATHGFAWPTKSQVSNPTGQTMTVIPALLRAGIEDARNDRERECYRIYSTPMGLLTELEVNYWRAGGMAATGELLEAYNGLFGDQNLLPIQYVVEQLENQGYSRVQIEIVVGWLIRGRYVQFDRDRLTLGRSM